MKPKNFSKLHKQKINRGNKSIDLILEVSNDGGGDSVWIFDLGTEQTFKKGLGDQKGYCTYMGIDWTHNQYSLKRCKLGHGLQGDTLVTKCKLPIEKCKSMEQFKQFVHEVIAHQIILGVYNK